MSYFTELRKALVEYLDDEQIELVYQAYLIARQAHKGQKRRSGEPYITHPVAAAVILANLRMDQQTIMATLLHDVIEDTSVTKADLAEQFGNEVAELVDGVSKLTQIKFETQAEAQAENFRKMILAMARDIRVILVKLADRLHNMQTLSAMPVKKRRRIAIETLEIYAPIANRLGMHNLYVELEDLGFAALYPMRARVLTEVVRKARGNRKEIMSKIKAQLTEILEKYHITYVSIISRQKHLYSIYKKMRNKSASFGEIMDVYGFRIISTDIDNCYRVLGAVHRLYKPVSERFKDYIAIPKANRYQSLHTTLFGPYGVPIEVQIRTEEMDKIAVNGIAAHWLYKSDEEYADKAQLQARKWAESLLEMQESTGSSLEFIENVKIDLFPDEVYVFTPKGHIMELPHGATPVDFAYMVHSDIGNSCVAAKINRRLAPLSERLLSGQTVEIVTAPGACPNPTWLNFIVTGKARSNIRHFLKNQQRTQLIALGKRLLEKALSDLSTSMAAVEQGDLDVLMQELHFQSFDELCEAIGLGNQVALVIAQRLTHQYEVPPSAQLATQPALAIKGTEGMVVTYARCCRPIPGDPIVGYLEAGHGLVVHVERCPEIDKVRNKPAQFINMRWEEKVTGEFEVDLSIRAINRRGMLAQLAGAIAEAEAGTENVQVKPGDGQQVVLEFTISVRDRIHLARVMRKIRVNKLVTRLSRIIAAESVRD